jgi:hypothetical protein
LALHLAAHFGWCLKLAHAARRPIWAAQVHGGGR